MYVHILQLHTCTCTMYVCICLIKCLIAVCFGAGKLNLVCEKVENGAVFQVVSFSDCKLVAAIRNTVSVLLHSAIGLPKEPNECLISIFFILLSGGCV